LLPHWFFYYIQWFNFTGPKEETYIQLFSLTISAGFDDFYCALIITTATHRVRQKNMKLPRFFSLLLNRWSAFLHDFLWIPTALLLAFWLRFNLGEIPEPFFTKAWHLLLIALPIQSFFFWHFALYRGVWRFASIPDLIRILKAVFLGTLVVILVGTVLFRLVNVPRSVLLLYPLLLVLGLSGSRILYRGLKDNRLLLKKQEGKRTLILGAGSAGESLVRHLIRYEEYLPVAFLDDDPKKQGSEIHGVRVTGKLEDLGKVISSLSIEIVLLAIPSADAAIIRKIVQDCTGANVTCRTLPSIVELGDKQIEARHLRPLTIEDLLGREAITWDIEAIAGYIQGKCILVTGGGGSIGSELCRQIADMKPRLLVIVEHSEFNLYSVEQELQKKFPKLTLECFLGNVKDQSRVEWVFKQFRPDVVFHAAAYKHVPMLEKNPAEGIHNNISGTRVVADAACKFGCMRFVLVSTDKAVNPANVMGATKRIAELYCQNLNTLTPTNFITTRFGNVLGSAGSVVPLFEEQIRTGGPVTVTHPDITRYFMTIPEAVSLILQAGSMGKGGEIFVLDMGKPILIRELAEQMIRLSGLKPQIDIQITYCGLRPGEKLYEQVFHEQEGLGGTGHSKLLLAESRRVDWNWLLQELDALEEAARGRNVEELLKRLKNIVPEFSGTMHPPAGQPMSNGNTKFRVVKGGTSQNPNKS
jgi:FlaA1/EpsC-like NDP-sugar epimerase